MMYKYTYQMYYYCIIVIKMQDCNFLYFCMDQMLSQMKGFSLIRPVLKTYEPLISWLRRIRFLDGGSFGSPSRQR